MRGYERLEPGSRWVRLEWAPHGGMDHIERHTPESLGQDLTIVDLPADPTSTAPIRRVDVVLVGGQAVLGRQDFAQVTDEEKSLATRGWWVGAAGLGIGGAVGAGLGWWLGRR